MRKKKQKKFYWTKICWLKNNIFIVCFDYVDQKLVKKIDKDAYKIIKAGQNCKLSMPVDIQTLASVMERNESYIFWLQPLLGNVQDQIPAISVNNSLYAINLRLEKAIFRRVRLCRNFCNIELMQDGTQKLRIPSRLLREKQRTSQRHMVK